MSKGHLAGRRAVVTGASSGIGAAVARRLAAEGADLVLVARREERLRALAEELVRQHRVAVEVKACDLARPDAREALFAEVNAGGAVDVLVNNAGFGVHGAFLSIPWERERELLEVDVAARAALALQARTVIPIHYEGWTHFRETRSQSETAFAAANISDRVLWLPPGVPTSVEA